MLLQVKWAATFILSLSYCHHHHHHYHHYQDLRKVWCGRSNGRLLQPVHLGGILRGSHGRRRRRCRCTTNRTGIYSSSSTILLCCLLFVFLCTSIQQTFFFFLHYCSCSNFWESAHPCSGGGKNPKKMSSFDQKRFWSLWSSQHLFRVIWHTIGCSCAMYSTLLVRQSKGERAENSWCREIVSPLVASHPKSPTAAWIKWVRAKPIPTRLPTFMVILVTLTSGWTLFLVQASNWFDPTIVFRFGPEIEHFLELFSAQTWSWQ